jgi:mRNA-degrading endonuclease RelE of RelBE toxin-antitoxin system
LSWTVSFSSRALHDLKQLDRRTNTRIVEAIERHAATGAGDVKRLRGRDDGWRLRVGDWCVLHRYRFDDKTVEIVRVVRRRDAYR